MRERMAQHRANPDCAVCHNTMDPLGLPLENFDAVGRWRERGETNQRRSMRPARFPDGATKFVGPVGLRQALVGRGDLFVTTLTEKLLIYALGAGSSTTMRRRFAALPRTRRATAIACRRSIVAIAKSTPFQMRRSDRLQPGDPTDDHSKALAAEAHVPARSWCGARAAVPRRDGPGADGGRAGAGQGAAANGLDLLPQRRHGVRLDARGDRRETTR